FLADFVESGRMLLTPVIDQIVDDKGRVSFCPSVATVAVAGIVAETPGTERPLRKVYKFLDSTGAPGTWPHRWPSTEDEPALFALIAVRFAGLLSGAATVLEASGVPLYPNDPGDLVALGQLLALRAFVEPGYSDVPARELARRLVVVPPGSLGEDA